MEWFHWLVRKQKEVIESIESLLYKTVPVERST